jgi:hypothetical protein
VSRIFTYPLPRVRVLAAIVLGIHLAQLCLADSVETLLCYAAMPLLELGFIEEKMVAKVSSDGNRPSLHTKSTAKCRRSMDKASWPFCPAADAVRLAFLRCGGASPPAPTRSTKTHVVHPRVKIERVYRPFLTATEAGHFETFRGIGSRMLRPKSSFWHLPVQYRQKPIKACVSIL